LFGREIGASGWSGERDVAAGSVLRPDPAERPDVLMRVPAALGETYRRELRSEQAGRCLPDVAIGGSALRRSASAV